MKRTKIIATIGPASADSLTLAKMIKSGMNVARLNFSHGEHKDHLKVIKLVRATAAKLGKDIALMQDLQGPRIRIGVLPKNGVMLTDNQSVTLLPEKDWLKLSDRDGSLPIQHVDLYRDVRKNQRLLIADGTIEAKIIKVSGNKIFCKVVIGGLVKSHKGLNLPDSCLSCTALSRKDLADLEFGIKQGVDFVAMSFVKSADDIIKLKKRIALLEAKNRCQEKNADFCDRRHKAQSGIRVRVIAKIERREAVKNFDKILEAADGIMVARGDLGLEVPFEQVPLLQKKFIDKSRQAGKPVIVATQMLESMILYPLPTRAEVADVANAILDGTDAIMLSGESATGKYPLKAVEAMAKIAAYAEKREIAEQEKREDEFKSRRNVTQVVSYLAQDLAEDISGAKLIVCATTSGDTARNIAKFRPETPIVAITPSLKTLCQLQLSWGVSAYLMPFATSFDELLANIKKLAVKNRLAKKRDIIIVVAGYPFGYKGKSNLLKVETV